MKCKPELLFDLVRDPTTTVKGFTVRNGKTPKLFNPRSIFKDWSQNNNQKEHHKINKITLNI